MNLIDVPTLAGGEIVGMRDGQRSLHLHRARWLSRRERGEGLDAGDFERRADPPARDAHPRSVLQGLCGRASQGHSRTVVELQLAVG